MVGGSVFITSLALIELPYPAFADRKTDCTKGVQGRARKETPGRGAETRPMNWMSLPYAIPMPAHKATFSTDQNHQRPWWRVWNDYPNPIGDALLGLFGIAVIVIVFWCLTMR